MLFSLLDRTYDVQSPPETMSRTLVSILVLEQIQLVVVLRVPPRSSLDDLRHDIFALGREMGGLDFFRDSFRGDHLFGRVCEDGRAVLCPCISIYALEVKAVYIRVPTSFPWRFALVGSCVR